MLKQLSAIAVAGLMFVAGAYSARADSQPSAAQTIYGIAVIAGTPQLVPLDAPMADTPAPTFPNALTVTPTPIVPLASATPTLVTPALATITPVPGATLAWGALPVCAGYPCYHDVDRIYETTNAVWVCRNANPCGSDPENQLMLRDVGTRVAALCVLEAAQGGAQWVSLTKCNAGHYGWSALKYNGRAYYKLIEDRD